MTNLNENIRKKSNEFAWEMVYLVWPGDVTNPAFLIRRDVALIKSELEKIKTNSKQHTY